MATPYLPTGSLTKLLIRVSDVNLVTFRRLGRAAANDAAHLYIGKYESKEPDVLHSVVKDLKYTGFLL